MPRIRFTANGSNSLLGGFGNGDIANVGDALARHLVEEARVARYIEAEAPRKPPQAAKVVRSRKVGAGDTAPGRNQ